MREGLWILAYYGWQFSLMLSVFLIVCIAGGFFTTWLATRRLGQKQDARPKRGWLLLVGLVVMLAGLAFAGGRWVLAYMEEHERRLDKMEKTFYLLDGTIDPESERGKGLFTDAEIDSIKEQRDKFPAKSARPAPYLTPPDS